MDCDEVDEHLARGEARTLTGREAARFDEHLATCATCRELANEAAPERDRWIVSVPEDALDDPDLLVLPTIDPVVFTTDRELARGGMGRITRVRDRRLGRDVAIKEVLDPAMRARFEREVAITAQLQHPAIVPIYEAGTWPDGSAFYTMRLVSGGTLAEAIAKTTTLEARLALLPHVLAMTDALAYAHARGIVHRDLKPGNVLVGEFGETVVIDWGLAKELRLGVDEAIDLATAHGRDLTRAGSVLGTPGFMAPEQATGADIDERADVYALGAILYNVLGGQAPYAGHTGDEAIELSRKQPPTPIAALAPRAPADLRAIVERAMARDPVERYPTAKEMAEELRRFEAGQLLQSRAYSTRELIARWVRRHRAVVIASTLAFVVVAVVGIGAVINIARSRAVAEASVTTLLEEQGRAELVAGEPDRAATLLVEAYQRGGDSVGLRHMLAAVTRDLDLRGPTVDHDDSIETFAFRDDGSLVTVDGEGISVAGKRIPFDVHIPRASFLTLTPNVLRVAIETENNRVQLREVATGAVVWEIDAPQDTSILFDPTSARFALWSEQATQLRDAATGALIVALPGAKARGAFSDDGSQFALCAGTELLVVDARTGARLSTQPGCAGVVAFLDAGRLVVQTSCCALHIWGDEKGPTPLPGSIGTIDSVTVHNGARRIVASDYSNTVTMWHSSSVLIGTTRSQGTPAFSPDGEYLVAGGMGDPLHVWSTDSFQLVHDVRVPTHNRPHYPLSVAWTRDSTRFAALHAGDKQLATFRVPRGARVFRQDNESARFADDVMLADAAHELVLQRIATGEVLKHLAFDPAQLSALDLSRDGRRALLVTDGSRQATVLDLQTTSTISTFKVERPFVELSADGRIVLEHDSSDPMPLRIRDATTGTILHDLSIPDEGELKLSPIGDRIAIPSQDSVRLLDTATGKIVATVPFDRTPLHVAFDPRGRRVFGYGSRARPRVIDARTGLVIAELPLPTSALELARFDASGDRILTWGNDRAAQLWNANTGELLATVERVAWGGIALSDDARRFATVSEDETIQIWDAATHRLIGTLPADHSGIEALAWSANDTRLISRGRTHTTVWDVHLEMRSPAELARLRTGWKLAGSLLVPD